MVRSSLRAPRLPCSPMRKPPATPSIRKRPKDCAAPFAAPTVSDAASFAGARRDALRRSSAAVAGEIFSTNVVKPSSFFASNSRLSEPRGALCAGVDAALDCQRSPAEVADRKPLDLQPLAVEAHAHIGARCFDAGERSRGRPWRRRSLRAARRTPCRQTGPAPASARGRDRSRARSAQPRCEPDGGRLPTNRRAALPGSCGRDRPSADRPR